MAVGVKGQKEESQCEGIIVVSSLVQKWSPDSDDVVQSAQKLLPLQQVLAALQGGVHLAVVAGELRQRDDGAAAVRGGAQQSAGQIWTDRRESR